MGQVVRINHVTGLCRRKRAKALGGSIKGFAPSDGSCYLAEHLRQWTDDPVTPGYPGTGRTQAVAARYEAVVLVSIQTRYPSCIENPFHADVGGCSIFNIGNPLHDLVVRSSPSLKTGNCDGIPDGFELAVSAILFDESFGLNPLNASDVYGDLDNDTLTNLEECEEGINSNDWDIDYDNDDKINFYDDNDDNDGGDMDDPWLTSWEVWWGLNPYFNEYSTEYDFDEDGLDNKYEWDNNNFINLTTIDTDGDGLDDGWEYNYWNVTRNQVEGWALTNCSRFDSDNDSASDGQELDGYLVTISWYVGEDLKSKEITVYGDPMFAYKDPNGNYLDVDNDGVYDIDEVDPRNSTRLEWYFEVLERDPRNQTAKDEQVQNQFNPFIKETIPPKIENVGIKTFANYHTEEILFVKIKIIDHCYTKITVEISDVSDFTVYIKVLDNGKYVKFEGNGNEVFEAIIDIDFWTDYLVDYKVKVIAVDSAGNEIEWEKKINGVFGDILDALVEFWNGLVGFYKAAYEKMISAVNFLIDFLINGFLTAIEIATAQINNRINNWANSIINSVQIGITDPIEQNKSVNSEIVALSLTTQVMTMATTIAALSFALKAIELAIVIMTTGVGAALGSIFFEIVKPIVLGLFYIGVTAGTISLLQEASSGKKSTEGIFGLFSDIDLKTSLIMGVSGVIVGFWELLDKSTPLGGRAIGFGTAMSGLILATIGASLGLSGIGLFVLDLISLSISVGGVYKMWKESKKMVGPEQSLNKIARITTAFEWALATLSIINGFCCIIAHINSGEYD